MIRGRKLIILNKLNFMRTFFITLIGFLTLSLSAIAQEDGSINGVVTTIEGNPLKNVNILIEEINKEVFSNSKGEFLLQEIPVGSYNLIASAIGFTTSLQNIQVSSGQTATIAFILNESFTTLSEITIKGGGLKVKNKTATVSTVSAVDIQRGNFTRAQTIMEEVPGIEISNYAQGGTASAFSMRGFGGGGHGGDFAIQIDGISLNESEGHADGYADMNVIIPLNLSKMDVYKGPTSSLFGNFANGGAISFETRKGGEYTDLSLQGGSFNTIDGQVAIGTPFELKNGKILSTNFAAQLYSTEGYMENSELLRGNIDGRIAYNITDRTDVALTLKGHSSRWNAPGFIAGNSSLEGGDQFHSKDRFSQGKNAENDGGNKLFASERIDVNHTFNDNLRLLVYGYSVQQNFTRFSKFGIAEGGQSEAWNDRHVYSTGASLNGLNQITTVDVHWVLGTEFYNEFTDKKTWATSNRVREEDAPDEIRSFRVQSYSIYGEAELDVVKFFRPSIGFRYDTFDGTLRFRDPGTTYRNADLNKQNHFSPKLGFRSTWVDGLDFRMNVSNGFTLPNGVERYDADMEVDPIKIWQYETGFNYEYSNWLNFDIAGYILDTSSEVNEIAPGSGEFLNSGKTRRTGVEVAADVKPFSGFRFNGNFAYVNTEIKDNPNADMIGKEVNGIPSTITTLAAEYTFKNGLGFRYKFKDVGEYATGGDNAFYYGGYTTSDVQLQYNFTMKSSQRAQLFVELNNIFDKEYATTVFDSFGGEGGQSFTPGMGRNFRIGINYSL